MSGPTREEWIEAIQILVDYYGDRSICPYNTRVGAIGNHGVNTCAFDCETEPSCHTDGPHPLDTAPDSVRRAIAEASVMWFAVQNAMRRVAVESMFITPYEAVE